MEELTHYRVISEFPVATEPRWATIGSLPAMEGNDPQHIASALGDVARSKGMTEIARKAGLGRQALYNALSESGNPTLETLTAVLGALGLQLTVQKSAA